MPDLFLVDFLWERMGLIETIEGIKALRKKWTIAGYSSVHKIAIEDKANGSAVIEVLKKEIASVIPIEPLGSKEARITAASNFIHGGNVWLPEAHPKIEDAVAEACGFPKAAHDDWIDMVSYGILLTLASGDLSRLEGLCRW